MPPLKREVHNAANTLATVHQIKAVIDLIQAHRVRDHAVDIDFAVHIPIDDLRHVCPTTGAAKAVPRQLRPVTNWKGRVLISAG